MEYLQFIMIIRAVISVAWYLTNKGEHATLYKINNNVYSETSKIISYKVIILYSSHMPLHTNTHTLCYCIFKWKLNLFWCAVCYKVIILCSSRMPLHTNTHTVVTVFSNKSWTCFDMLCVTFSQADQARAAPRQWHHPVNGHPGWWWRHGGQRASSDQAWKPGLGRYMSVAALCLQCPSDHTVLISFCALLAPSLPASLFMAPTCRCSCAAIFRLQGYRDVEKKRTEYIQLLFSRVSVQCQYAFCFSLIIFHLWVIYCRICLWAVTAIRKQYDSTYRVIPNPISVITCSIGCPENITEQFT